MNKYRTATSVVGIVGNIRIKSVLDALNHLAIISARTMMVAFGEILWLPAVVGDAGRGILMFPVLKQHSELMANGCLATRIVKADSITSLQIGSATNKELILLLEFPHKPNKSDISGRLRPLISSEPGTRFSRLRTLRVLQSSWRENNETGVSGSLIRRQLIQSQLNSFLLF